jgi:ParB family chromosome partitioning protein
MHPPKKPPSTRNGFADRRKAYAKRNSRRTIELVTALARISAPANESSSARHVTHLDYGHATPVSSLNQELPIMASGVTSTLQRVSAYAIEPEKLIVPGIDRPFRNAEEERLESERVNAPLNEATVISMMLYGVQKTVFVRRDGDKLEVWDGKRRVLHAREANKRLKKAGAEGILVKIEVKAATDEQIFALQRLNNRHHVDESPLQTAEAAALMLSKGRGKDEVAAVLNIGVPMLDIYLKLNDLHQDVRESVATGEVSPTAAAKLASLPRDQQVTALAEMRKSGELTVAAAAATRSNIISRKAANGPAKKPKSDITPPPPRRVLAKLVEHRKELEVDVPRGFWDGVEFALGRMPARSIKGMQPAITQLTTPKGKKKSA